MLLTNLLLGTAFALHGVAQGNAGVPARCAGGAYINFARGSHRLDDTAAERLRNLAIASRDFRQSAQLQIESAGDGEGSRFDRDLSLRRSEAIRRYLSRYGYRQVMIRVRAPGPTETALSEADQELLTLGWVGQLLSPADYARQFPGRNRECF